MIRHNRDSASRCRKRPKDRVISLRDGVLVELQRSLEGA
jgi:hypothetical protein